MPFEISEANEGSPCIRVQVVSAGRSTRKARDELYLQLARLARDSRARHKNTRRCTIKAEIKPARKRAKNEKERGEWGNGGRINREGFRILRAGDQRLYLLGLAGRQQ